jgi:hypothetical protein
MAHIHRRNTNNKVEFQAATPTGEQWMRTRYADVIVKFKPSDEEKIKAFETMARGAGLEISITKSN